MSQAVSPRGVGLASRTLISSRSPLLKSLKPSLQAARTASPSFSSSSSTTSPLGLIHHKAMASSSRSKPNPSTPRSVSPSSASSAPPPCPSISMHAAPMKKCTEQSLNQHRGYVQDQYCSEVRQTRKTEKLDREMASGYQIIREPLWNKGLSFTPEERVSNNLTGLIPHAMESLETQCARAMKMVRTRQDPIDKYLYLSSVKAHNVDLFYRLLMDNIRELMPLVYTPTIGDVCLQYSSLYTRPEALYISIKQRKSIRTMLRNWPCASPDICVVTDGSRILGLGDLGINGVGISVGKLALYTAAAGIHPDKTLPVVLDCGTDNETNLADPLYLGLRQRRVPSDVQQEFMDEFMDAVKAVFPNMLVQFEDFESEKAFRYLDRYRDSHRAFNDDIQGTGAVVLAGYINAVKLSGVPLEDQRLVFMGAGSAGVGVAKQLVEYYTRQGLTEAEARSKFYLVDTKGLVTLDRGDRLAAHKTYFARSDNGGRQFRTLAEVIEHVRPSALVGLAATHGIFTEGVVRSLKASVESGGSGRRPILFPLSNPLTKAECTFEQAVRWTDGAAIFASGSPFAPVEVGGGAAGGGGCGEKGEAGERGTVTHHPNQGNNVYVFPGLGLGAILAKASRVTDNMVYESAAALAGSLGEDEAARGLIYPVIDRVREASIVVAREVMKAARRDGVSQLPGHLWAEWEEWGDVALTAHIRRSVYDPVCFADAKGRL